MAAPQMSLEDGVDGATERDHRGLDRSQFRQLFYKAADVLTLERGMFPKVLPQLPGRLLLEVFDDVGHVGAPESRPSAGKPELVVCGLGRGSWKFAKGWRITPREMFRPLALWSLVAWLSLRGSM
jgi:hypothetical protein